MHAMELMDVKGDDDAGVVADGAADAVVDDAAPEMLIMLQQGCDAEHVCPL